MTKQPTEMHDKPIVATWTGKVVGVTDGDTVKVLNDAKETISIRLESIDAPEKKQPFGQKSKQALSQLVFSKRVTVHETGKDFFKRTLAFVTVNDIDVCRWMIANGFAWHYKKHSKNDELAREELNAFNAKLGLWAEESTPPWVWRKKSRKASEE